MTFGTFRNFLFFFSTAFGLLGQNPIPAGQITEFNANLKAISFGKYGAGVERCVFWLNSPTIGQVQVACYLPNNPTPPYNSIQRPAEGVQGYFRSPSGVVTWILRAKEFHLAAMGFGTAAEIKLDGTF